MEHTCQDCSHTFNEEGQNGPHIAPAVQCPQCHSYRTQPSGIPDEANDMLHGLDAMPTSTQDDMSGNPLQEGVLGDWKNRSVRDETFASVRMSLFETPEFETTGLLAPPDLYRHALETEAAHRAHVQIPNGITDNLHAALGNLGAWVENPYENGQLRPYNNKYWRVIRPSFMKPGSLQVGVAEPTMAEIINHVAQSDDLTPLYEYRGQDPNVKTAGWLTAMLPEAVTGLFGGGAAAAEAGGAAAATGAGEAAGASAGGVGGVMKSVMNNVGGTALNSVDDLVGAGGGAGNGQGVPDETHPASFYGRIGSDEDDAHPNSHEEIPKNDDGDHAQQDDGNHHEWQRDISVDDQGGGAQHTPSFDPGGTAFQQLLSALPLLKQYIDTGEDGSQDPIVQALHQALEQEIPGYQDHGDEAAGKQLLLILSPEGAAKPEDSHEPGLHHEPDHTDENSGGGHESKVAHLVGEAAGEFLPDLDVVAPSLHGARVALLGAPPGGPPMGGPPMGGPPMGAPMGGPPPGASPMPATPGAPADASQGPVTDEQQAWFASWLEQQGRADEIPKMLADPALYAKEFAHARGREVPPEHNETAAPQEPMPAQEEAPPGDTMPMPGMSAGPQMTAAVARYAADSVAGRCPECGSHTTETLDDSGQSHCHACNAFFATEGLHLNKIDKDASTWNVDEDFRKEAFSDELPSVADDPALNSGEPIADQQGQHDVHGDHGGGHTWTDKVGNPLKVGQEYEMYSDKFDIPDLVRIEAVKPHSIVYSLTGEFGFDQSAELTKEEANLDGTSFVASAGDGELGPSDDGSLEANNDDNSGFSGSPEHTDLSAPHGSVEAKVAASGINRETPALAWLMEGLPKTAGASYTPMEQRALIDEQGTARNANALQLEGTHYLTEADDDQFIFGL